VGVDRCALLGYRVGSVDSDDVGGIMEREVECFQRWEKIRLGEVVILPNMTVVADHERGPCNEKETYESMHGWVGQFTTCKVCK